MSSELMGFNSNLMQKYTVNEIVACNNLTAQYALVLTEAQAIELVEVGKCSLQKNGRIEFGSGIINKIIKEFCNSPYISMHNYSQTLHELIEMFYCYKNECLDLISDDDLLKFMHQAFDGICQGSLELLSGRELSKLALNLRYGLAADYSEDNNKDKEDDLDGEYNED